MVTMTLLPYLHLVLALLYLSGMVFVGGFLIPAARRFGEGQRTLQSIAQVIKVVHPISLASLGLLIITGAAMLTDLKAALGGRYFSQLFSTLGPKLLVVFILALLNSYQFFGLGLRLTRSMVKDAGGQEVVEDDRIATALMQVGRLQRCAWIGAALGGAALYLGLAMGRGW
ncbi:MAG: hypothetical protein HW395_250 [candidate division NC10 bacterium]|nr:hypothetical protein [candidate division NC10 bacterium]